MKRLASECIRIRMRKRSALNCGGPFESVSQVGWLPVSHVASIGHGQQYCADLLATVPLEKRSYSFQKQFSSYHRVMNLSFVQNNLYRQFSSYHHVMNLPFVQNILYRQFCSYHRRHETVIVHMS